MLIQKKRSRKFQKVSHNSIAEHPCSHPQVNGTNLRDKKKIVYSETRSAV
ncbi:hypothetical protein IQ258_08170 [Coleofasciculus sp. LEGE 07081]|nr:hypothetical protein [Coleofasciculus sp. LEGE 07081]